MASETDTNIIKTSQDLLNKIVKKPVITEKLLKRPPFRFLHDLIISIVKTHGFFKDLYKDNEMIAENVKEKDTKIGFLQKAIDATGFIIGDVVNVKPSKIVAGLEVEKTNDWLQIMARAVIEKKSSSDAVKRVLNGEKPTKKNSTTNSNNNNTNNKKKALNESTKTSNNNTNTKTKKETKESTEMKSQPKNQIKETIESKEVIEAKERTSPLLSANNEEHNSLKQSKQELTENSLNGNASKPGSASDNSPTNDNRDDTNAQNESQNKQIDKKTNDFTKNNEISEQKLEVDQIKTVRPKTGANTTLPPNLTQNSVTETVHSVRPPTRHQRTARPSSSRPAPPRVIPKTNEDNKIVEAELEEKLRLLNAKPVENLITENLTNDELDRDFIVSNVVKSDELESNERLEFDGITEQKGSLVKQLVETKKELEGNQSSDLPNDDKKPIRQTNRDIEKLRQTIQSLSQTANPLGKVLDYLQEDIDSMLSELKLWREEYKRNVQSLEKSRNNTLAELEPYRQELNLLDTNISEQIEKISLTKANIIRNEEKLQKMVQIINRI